MISQQSGGSKRRLAFQPENSNRAAIATMPTQKDALDVRGVALDLSHLNEVRSNNRDGCGGGIEDPQKNDTEWIDDAEATVDTLEDYSCDSSAVRKADEATVVRFSTVEIREYARTLGDNPSVTSGPPLTLEWTHQSTSTIDFESYESTKPLSRAKGQMLVPQFVREEWLRDAGYSRGEMTEATRKAGKSRVRRRKSANQNMAGRKVDEMKDSFGAFRRRALTKKRSVK